MKILLPLVAAGRAIVFHLSGKAGKQPGATLPQDAQQQLRRELRRARRVGLVVPVKIKGYQHTMTGSTRDISGSGMLLTPEARLSIAEPVEVSFVLPEGPRIEIAGAVCRLQGSHAGICFDAADKQRLVIEQWIEQQSASVSA